MNRTFISCLLFVSILLPSTGFSVDFEQLLKNNVNKGDIVRYAINRTGDGVLFLNFVVNKNLKVSNLLSSMKHEMKANHIRVLPPYPEYITRFAKEAEITLGYNSFNIEDIKIIKSIDTRKENINLKKGNYLSFYINGFKKYRTVDGKETIKNTSSRVIKEIKKDQKLLDFLQVSYSSFTPDGLVITHPSLIKSHHVSSWSHYIYYADQMLTLSDFEIVGKIISEEKSEEEVDCKKLVNSDSYGIYKIDKNGSGVEEKIIRNGYYNKVISDSFSGNGNRFLDIFFDPVKSNRGYRKHTKRYLDKININNIGGEFKGVFQDSWVHNLGNNKKSYRDVWGSWKLSVLEKKKFYVKGCLLDISLIEVDYRVLNNNKKTKGYREKYWYSADLNLVVKSDRYELFGLEVIEGSNE